MKRFIALVFAVAAVVCSCQQKSLDELNSRLDAVDAGRKDVVTRMDAINELLNAQATGITITSVKTTDNGTTVVFSNGKSFTIADGEDKIVVTEDDKSFTFDFGNDDVIEVYKTFSISFDEESYEAAAVSEVVIKYTITGDTGSAHVFADSKDCKVISIDEDACEITVRASSKEGEHLVHVRAIRNSDGKIIEKFVPVVSGPRAPVALEGALSAFYGESSKAGVHNYYTQFWLGDVDEEDHFVGDAYSLIFDFYSPVVDEMVFPEGTFSPAEDGAPFTYVVGVQRTFRAILEDELWIYEMFFGISSVEELAEFLGYPLDSLDEETYYSGAELYHQFEDGSYEDYAITDGTVTVELTGKDSYKVTMELVANESNWTITYEGEIPVVDRQPALTVYDYATAAKVSSNSDGTTTWNIVLEQASQVDLLDLYIVTDNANEIPAGDYAVSDSGEAFTVVAGDSALYEEGWLWDNVDDGVLKIKKTSNGEYELVGYFTDYTYAESFNCYYTGAFDAPAGAVSVAKDRLNERKLQLATKPAKAKGLVEAYKARYEGRKAPHVPFFFHN